MAAVSGGTIEKISAELRTPDFFFENSNNTVADVISMWELAAVEVKRTNGLKMAFDIYLVAQVES